MVLVWIGWRPCFGVQASGVRHLRDAEFSKNLSLIAVRKDTIAEKPAIFGEERLLKSFADARPPLLEDINYEAKLEDFVR